MSKIEKGYNVNETARLLAIKPRTVRKWIKEGIINAAKIEGTRRWIVSEDEIRRLQGYEKRF